MALFGGQRDMSLFRTVNKELINDVIDTEVYYYKVIVTDSKTNLYGESKDKIYFSPCKIPSLITREESAETFDEFGTSYTRNATFAFLRDTLVDKNIVPEIGDVIEWNNEHFIVDSDAENQFFAGKNPDTWDGGNTQGYNVSITVSTHVARKSQLKIQDNFRVGINKDNNDLPIGI